VRTEGVARASQLARGLKQECRVGELGVSGRAGLTARAWIETTVGSATGLSRLVARASQLARGLKPNGHGQCLHGDQVARASQLARGLKPIWASNGEFMQRRAGLTARAWIETLQ